MPVSPMIEAAQAKINLTLHVGGRRPDGYHPLESIVVFAALGDELSASPANEFGVDISGPFSKDLLAFDIDHNLVLKAARASGHPPTQFSLIKQLPIASGIGGGSADAAAALRLMQRLYGPIDKLGELALSLGADVPVCLAQEPAFMSGIGETIRPISGIFHIFELPAVLVNPGIAVSTGAIFDAYDVQISDRGAPDISHVSAEVVDHNLIEAIKRGRNDLQDIACQITPVIGTVLDQLAHQDGVCLTRMSGSGATCFAIFDQAENARKAREKIQAAYPDWWCMQTQFSNQHSDLAR